MGARIGAVGVLALLAVASVNAQPFRLGMVLSSEFLAGLVSQQLSRSQVAIINANVGSAVIFDRSAPDGTVTFLQGSDNFLWAQIAEQLADSAAKGEPMHLTIKRWSIASCSSATTDVREFLARLNDVTSDLDGESVTQKDEITVDATAFRIIARAKDAWVNVAPEGAFDPPLQQTAARVHSAVSGCAKSLVPSVEQHAF